MLDLSERELAIVQGIVRKHVPRVAVWAFGSRVKGDARRYSDLDHAVIAHTPLPLAVRGALQDDFAESDLPFRVDVLDWATTGEAFRRVIEQNKTIVQSTPEAG
jgi:predicted nucleotidyltransferase